MPDERDLVVRLKGLARECPGLAHTFKFIVSAVFALREARIIGHRDRAGYGAEDRAWHVRHLMEGMDAIVAGRPLDRIWMAGFHYNAAIMRIAACHERFLKAMVLASGVTPGKTTNVLARQLEAALDLQSPPALDYLALVREEVNKLMSCTAKNPIMLVHGLYPVILRTPWQRWRS